MNLRTLTMVALLAAAVAGAGAAAVLSSSYDDVGSLAGLSDRLRVTVEGYTVDMGTGTVVLEVNGESYTLDARGFFAIPVGGSDGYVLFLLRGDNGFTVAALHDAREFIARYGGNPVVEATVVVDGVYDPSVRARITLVETGETVEVPVLWINTVLKGCHASYEQPPATTEA